MLQKAHRNFSIFFQMKKLYYWMKERNFRTVSLSNGGSAFHLSLTILVRYLSHSSFIEEGGSSFSRENVLYRYVFLFEFFFHFFNEKWSNFVWNFKNFHTNCFSFLLRDFHPLWFLFPFTICSNEQKIEKNSSTEFFCKQSSILFSFFIQKRTNFIRYYFWFLCWFFREKGGFLFLVFFSFCFL